MPETVWPAGQCSVRSASCRGLAHMVRDTQEPGIGVGTAELEPESRISRRLPYRVSLLGDGHSLFSSSHPSLYEEWLQRPGARKVAVAMS